MGKRKNAIKSNINTCFCCGVNLNKIEDKIIHRINQKKTISKNNVIILCKYCKKEFSIGRRKVFDIDLYSDMVKDYFSELDPNYRNLVLANIKRQRSINGYEESKNRIY